MSQQEQRIGRVSYTDYANLLGRSIPDDHMLQCPLHDDQSPSFSLFEGRDGNVLWRCHGKCNDSGSIMKLAKLLGQPMELPGQQAQKRKKIATVESDPEVFVEEAIRRLDRKPESQQFLQEQRGIAREVQLALRYGLDYQSRYVIPTYDAAGKLLAIKTWKKPSPGETKGSWLTAYGGVELYGLDALSYDDVILVEGEFDCACARSFGFPNTLTHTGGARNWRDDWSSLFYGKTVTIAYDNDDAGQQGARKVAKALAPYASTVSIVRWPLKHPAGADVSDELRFKDADSFRRLLRRAGRFYAENDAVEPMGWTSIPHGRIPDSLLCDPSITPLAKLVYATIQRYTDKTTGRSQVSLLKLAEKLGFSERSIRYAIKHLKGFGYLEVLPQRFAYDHVVNTYRCKLSFQEELGCR